MKCAAFIGKRCRIPLPSSAQIGKREVAGQAGQLVRLRDRAGFPPDEEQLHLPRGFSFHFSSPVNCARRSDDDQATAGM